MRTGLTAASLALCLAAGGLSGCSHCARDYDWEWVPWPADAAGGRWVKADAESSGGQVELSWRVWTAADRDQLIQHDPLGAVAAYHRAFPDVPKRFARLDAPTVWNAVGFNWYSGPTHSSVWVPYWPAVRLTAWLPGWWAVARTRRRRLVLAGRCSVCGYDLRASSVRCPECGCGVSKTIAPPVPPEIS